jgi:hypothetical protein
MKRKLWSLVLGAITIGTVVTFYSFSNDDCCATCSGSRVCNACKNCNYCKHCSKEGGVCGVCSPESFEVKKKLAKKDTTIKKARKSTYK